MEIYKLILYPLIVLINGTIVVTNEDKFIKFINLLAVISWSIKLGFELYKLKFYDKRRSN